MSNLEIVHRADSFLVLSKPEGLLAVPGIGPHKQDCVISRVKAMFPQACGPLMVHRLDMNTSGLMVVGLTPESQRFLSQEFEARRVSKRYIALLDGVVEPSEGVISLPLRLDVDRRPFQIVDFIHGKRALTQYRVLARSSASTRIEFSPLTGRTHQLRVHAAVPPHRYAHDPARPADASAGGLGCPIRGDMLYGDAATAPRLMLHASYLAFRSPETLEQVEFFRTDALGDP